MIKFDEKTIRSGARPDMHDGRDFLFGAYLENYEDKIQEVEIDWDNDYKEIQDYKRFLVKNQMSSLSCVGQTGAHYKEALEYYLKRDLKEKSAKSVYSQIALPSGGAFFRDGMKIITEYGINLENDVKSYKEDGSVNESFISDKSWVSDELTKKANYYANQNYYSINSWKRIAIKN